VRMTEQEYMDLLERKGVKTVRAEKPKKSKYRSKKAYVGGIPFDSQLEADYYSNLVLLQAAGEIVGFCRQPRFVLEDGDASNNPIEYVSDFIVFHKDGTYQIVDTKGDFHTEIFKIKHKLFRRRYPKLVKHFKIEGRNE